MKKVHELLKLRPCAGDVGIEIEVEGNNLNPIDSPRWKTEDDGSLRGEYPRERSEYVLRKPIRITHVKEALDELIEHQKDAKINFSFRCSAHVHINVTDLTESQLLAYLYLCVLLEEPLMNICGNERKGNRFCLRISDADGYTKFLNRLFEDGIVAMRHIHANSVRYSAINIASLSKYGSIEFRGMQGTLDKDVLIPWVQVLYRLREAAKKFNDPVAVHDAFISMSNEDFARKYIGRHANLFDIQSVSKEMDNSFSLSIEMPHKFLKLEKREPPIEEPVPLPKAHVVKVNWEDMLMDNPMPIRDDAMDAMVRAERVQVIMRDNMGRFAPRAQAAPADLRWQAVNPVNIENLEF